MRGIAIILVLLFHYGVQQGGTVPGSIGAYVLKGLSLSWSGVDLFFVLSGYLIGGILLDHVHEQNSFRIFYTRRFLRIVPLYAFVLVVGLGCGAASFAPIYYYLTFTQNIWIATYADFTNYYGVTWSLAVEEQFYVLLPLLVWLLPRTWLPAALVSLIVLAPICRIFALGFFKTPIAPYVLFPCRMDALLCGVLCAYAMSQAKIRDWLFHNRVILYGTLVILLAWPALATLKGWSLFSFQMQSFGFTLLAFAYACFLLIAIVEKSGPVAWLTRLAPLGGFGMLAYCIYLIHPGVLNVVSQVLGRSFPADWLLLGVSLISVMIIAGVSWRFFERPLVSLGHRWTYSGQVLPTFQPDRSRFCSVSPRVATNETTRSSGLAPAAASSCN